MNPENLKNQDKKYIIEIERIIISILEKTTAFVQHLDQQINILVGISSGVFIFSVSNSQKEGIGPTLMILGLFSAASILVGLFAIHPPKFMRKRGQAESLLYNKKITQFNSPKDYAEELTKMLEERGIVIEEYAREIYNMIRYYYRPKRKLFHIARNIFVLGILISSLFFVSRVFE